MAGRNYKDWEKEEDAKVLFGMEKYVVNEGKTAKKAFELISAELDQRPASAVKKRWEKELRSQAQGKLAEWVSNNYRSYYANNNIPVLQPKKKSDRAQLINLITLANNELEGIDGEIDELVDQLQKKQQRKVDLQANLSEKTKELQEMLLSGLNKDSEESSSEELEKELV